MGVLQCQCQHDDAQNTRGKPSLHCHDAARLNLTRVKDDKQDRLLKIDALSESLPAKPFELTLLDTAHSLIKLLSCATDGCLWRGICCML